jgi:Zn-finger nucleic acid-binding protein
LDKIIERSNQVAAQPAPPPQQPQYAPQPQPSYQPQPHYGKGYDPRYQKRRKSFLEELFD